MRFILIISFTAVSIALNAQVKNITISSINSPNEPSLAMHPTNPNILWAGTNHNNLYYSSDGGKTWQHELGVSKYGCAGDPVMHINKNGELLYFHLSNPKAGYWLDRIVVQKRKSFDQFWTTDTYTGLNPKKQQDKQWVAEDKNSGALYLTWTQFDKYGSADENMFSNIMFSKSVDGGDTWSIAKNINTFKGDCIDDDNTVEGAVPAVDKNGNIHVAWSGPKGIVYQKSLDEGETWLKTEKIITPHIGGWAYDVEGIYRCNGLPLTCVDRSNSAFSNSIYINWSDTRNGEKNPDVFLVYSRDGGETWSDPKKINNDNSENAQFLTWMAVDETTGYIYCVFYDRRNHYDTKTDVFLAVSTNGGESFENYQINEHFFEPDPKVFFGDYTNIVAQNNIVQVVFNSFKNKTLTLETARIKPEDLTGKKDVFLPEPGNFRITIAQNNGILKEIISDGKLLNAGWYTFEDLGVTKNLLVKGNNYIEVFNTINNQLITRKNLYQP